MVPFHTKQNKQAIYNANLPAKALYISPREISLNTIKRTGLGSPTNSMLSECVHTTVIALSTLYCTDLFIL